MEDGTPKPTEANDFYTAKRWWPENEQAVNGVPSAATKHNSDYYNSNEIFTPQVPREGDRVVLKDLIGMGGEEDDDVEERRYFRPAVSSEIEEISEDGESETDNRESGAEDIYVAVGNDDIDVVKWALDHAVSPSSRIFFVHVSVPVTLIPTPVGNLPISQLNQQRVRSYENEEINKTNHIMQKYIQLSNDAQVRAETVHLENNDTAKALLELISVLNIRNLVMGIKKPPHPWGKNKLSRGEIVKQNAPEFCEVALVCVGNEVGKKSHYDIVSQRRHHSSGRFMSCLCFSGSMNGVDD